jgi:hypothetical protein
MKAALIASLRAAAAKAEQLAQDVERNRLWDGDLDRGIAEIRAQLDRASRETEGKSNG